MTQLDKDIYYDDIVILPVTQEQLRELENEQSRENVKKG